MSQKLPITAAEVPDAWTADVSETLRRNGRAMRAHATLPMIELKSLHTNQWSPIMLFGSGMLFTTNAERDSVMRRIEAS